MREAKQIGKTFTLHGVCSLRGARLHIAGQLALLASCCKSGASGHYHRQRAQDGRLAGAFSCSVARQGQHKRQTPCTALTVCGCSTDRLVGRWTTACQSEDARQRQLSHQALRGQKAGSARTARPASRSGPPPWASQAPACSGRVLAGRVLAQCALRRREGEGGR